MTITETDIVVDRPVRVVYDQWTQFEEFPRFMRDVERVEQLGDTLLHWTVSIAGQHREWDAEILEQVPDQAIAWASTAGTRNAGRVSFESLDDGRTRVRLELDFEPDGVVDKLGDTLGVVARRAEDDLERFKEFIEERASPTGAWRGEVHTDGLAAGSGAAAPITNAAPSQTDRLLQEP